MARTLNLVAVSGSLQRPSRTLALVEHLVEKIGDAVPVRVRTIELGAVGPRLAGALYR
ncbi:FMN reductase, partial [Corallococcus coralloides]|nr:FMN reductase [Corallococcus coralloides]